jgi:hypothetical protein
MFKFHESYVVGTMRPNIAAPSAYATYPPGAGWLGGGYRRTAGVVGLLGWVPPYRHGQGGVGGGIRPKKSLSNSRSSVESPKDS